MRKFKLVVLGVVLLGFSFLMAGKVIFGGEKKGIPEIFLMSKEVKVLKEAKVEDSPYHIIAFGYYLKKPYTITLGKDEKDPDPRARYKVYINEVEYSPLRHYPPRVRPVRSIKSVDEITEEKIREASVMKGRGIHKGDEALRKKGEKILNEFKGFLEDSIFAEYKRLRREYDSEKATQLIAQYAKKLPLIEKVKIECPGVIRVDYEDSSGEELLLYYDPNAPVPTKEDKEKESLESAKSVFALTKESLSEEVLDIYSKGEGISYPSRNAQEVFEKIVEIMSRDLSKKEKREALSDLLKIRPNSTLIREIVNNFIPPEPE